MKYNPSVCKAYLEDDAESLKKFVSEPVAIILIMIEKGMPQKYAAARANIAESLFYEWKKDKKKVEFLECIKKAESKFISANLDNIKEHQSKSWQASAWLLERRVPDEFKERSELSTDEAGIKINYIVPQEKKPEKKKEKKPDEHSSKPEATSSVSGS